MIDLEEMLETISVSDKNDYKRIFPLCVAVVLAQASSVSVKKESHAKQARTISLIAMLFRDICARYFGVNKAKMHIDLAAEVVRLVEEAKEADKATLNPKILH